jgi:RNA polymerase sigma-70 factor (ECF subfamily)
MKQIYYSDIKLLQQKIAFDRDERSYKMLFLHFYKPLLIFAESYVKNHETAEEIVSDVMMRLWAKNEGVAAIDNLKVYLYMATRNTAINYLSITSKYTLCDIEEADVYINSNINNPEEKLLSDELQRKILSAVQQLPPKCQMVYKLVREDGFRYKEVAAVLSISENTVDRHLNNALHKMVKVVKTYFQES